MPSVNKAIILGHCGRDPEMRYSAEGAAMTNVSVATSHKWTPKGGEAKEETTWHNVQFFGKLAEIAGEYLKKGSPVFIEGRIRNREWTDKEGNKRTSTEIIADSMQMLGAKSDAKEPPTKKAAPNRQPKDDDEMF